MTREQFVKYKFNAYTRIDFKSSSMPQAEEMMLIGIDFDTEILTLRPFPESAYEQEDFPAHISMCGISRGLKLSKNN